jgi:hypothetical protein
MTGICFVLLRFWHLNFEVIALNLSYESNDELMKVGELIPTSAKLEVKRIDVFFHLQTNFNGHNFSIQAMQVIKLISTEFRTALKDFQPISTGMF